MTTSLDMRYRKRTGVWLGNHNLRSREFLISTAVWAELVLPVEVNQNRQWSGRSKSNKGHGGSRELQANAKRQAGDEAIRHLG